MALQMKLHHTSGYHPEADGQTERTNQTLEQYLRTYCNYQQSDWAHLLSLAKFAYNNAPSATTKESPFFANKSYHPRLQIQTDLEPLSENSRPYLAKLESVYEELKRNIVAAQNHYQGPSDAKRSPAPKIQVGDFVFVLAKFIRTTRPSKKLSKKFLGPFEIIGKPGSHSYQVKLPAHLRSIHPVFHISQLEPTSPSNIEGRHNPPPPPIEVEGNIEYEIAQVLDSKLDCWRKFPLLYYIQWAGYEGTADEFSWLGADESSHASELVQEFHKHYPQKPGPLHENSSRL